MECELAYWRGSGKHLNKKQPCVQYELHRTVLNRCGFFLSFFKGKKIRSSNELGLFTIPEIRRYGSHRRRW